MNKIYLSTFRKRIERYVVGLVIKRNPVAVGLRRPQDYANPDIRCHTVCTSSLQNPR